MKRYTPPTGDEIRALLKRYNLTEAQAASLIGITEDDMKNHIWNVRPIPYKVWYSLTTKLEFE